jgi:hypothetical protein
MYFNGTKSCLLAFSCFLSLSSMAKEVKEMNSQGLRKPLCFVENKGQVLDDNNDPRADIQYKLTAPGISMYVGNGQLHYQFKKMEGNAASLTKISTCSMDVTLLGANPKAIITPAGKQGYYENYFFSSSATNAVTAHSFNKIIYKEVYPGIDWVLYVKDNNVEYDFVVRPGANINNIKLQYNGATDLRITDDGSISAKTLLGGIKENRPYAFENASGRAVASKFVLRNNVVSFEAGNYKGTLTIDPYLMFSTYFGGVAEDVVTSVKETSSGITFAGGYTASSGLGTAGVTKPLYPAGPTYMAFLAKYSAAGTLLFTTYFGGNPGAYLVKCTSIALDNTGGGNPNVYIAGYTTGNSLPITTGGAYRGLNDGFVAKLNNTGSGVFWCTYFGGVKNDYINGIACDAANNVYITGQTASTGLGSGGSYQNVLSGPSDAFVAKLSSGTGGQVWCTYYGGSADEEADGIALDASGNIVITGQTNSIIKVATAGAYQTVLAGSNDAFLAKLNNAGSALSWGTYFGGGGQEQGFGVVCDPLTGNIAVVGNTTSATGIAGLKAAQPVYGGGVQDAFVSYWDATGKSLWSTYYGGSSLDYGQGICLDNTGNIVVTGGTFSANGIASTLSFQNTIGGDYDAYLTKYNEQGQVLWGTYFGGTLYDYANSVACDNNNQLTIGGYTTSIGTYGTGGLSTPGAAQPSFAGGTYDGFITKFKVDTILQIAQPFTDTLVCAGGTLDVNYISNFAFPVGNMLFLELSDIAGDFTTFTTIGSVVTTPLATSGVISGIIPALITPGTKYRIRINSGSPAYNSPDDFFNISIVPNLLPTIATGTTPICVGSTLTLSDAAAYAITSYTWAGPTGSGPVGTGFTAFGPNPTNKGFSGTGVTLADAGTYSVTTTHNGCPSSTSTVKITVSDIIPPVPSDSAGLINCFGSPIYLFANPDTAATGITYNWVYPSGATSTAQNPVIPSASYIDTGYYQLNDVLNGCPSNFTFLHVSVQPVIPVSIYITATPGDTICQGKLVSFAISTVNEGYTPHYQWMSGAFTPIVGANSSTFASSTLIDMETIFCVLSSSVTCPSPVNAASNIIKMNVISNPPIAYITATPSARAAVGTAVLLRSTTYNGGTGVLYQWKKNGVNIIGATYDTLVIPVLNENDTISLLITSTMQCAAPDTAISNVLIVGSNVGVANVTPSLGNISLYPNPNNGTFTLKGDVESANTNTLSFEILNPIGQIIYRDNAAVQHSSFTKTIDLNNLADGIYLLHLSAGRQSKTIRFQVQH